MIFDLIPLPRCFIQHEYWWGAKSRWTWPGSQPGKVIYWTKYQFMYQNLGCTSTPVPDSPCCTSYEYAMEPESKFVLFPVNDKPNCLFGHPVETGYCSLTLCKPLVKGQDRIRVLLPSIRRSALRISPFPYSLRKNQIWWKHGLEAPYVACCLPLVDLTYKSAEDCANPWWAWDKKSRFLQH